ncbi:MAG: antibiotic biosynthesis monooxygenase [Ginsengibacter sp.]|jgi:heme-degrading monooxygenase HmoA
MILEVAVLYIKRGEETQFEKDFSLAGKIISSANGYVWHSLRKCIEQENKYLLLVEWNTLEDHTNGFRKSEAYIEWKHMLHHYYDPFPVVEHFEMIMGNHK